jgi:malonate-semialdehyde dehydrogenase (acetylating)/methylmalonate-semialdehyde dehydrogenase
MPLKQLHNIYNGQKFPVQSQDDGEPSFTVRNPATSDVMARFSNSTPEMIDSAISSLKAGFESWKLMTVKSRSQILFKFRSLILDQYKTELVELIMLENGKHRTDATASLLKGVECIEYALNQFVGSSGIQEVSSGVYCQDRRDPVGVIVSIVPFNFPAMVPLWTLPNCLLTGNCLLIKPSEKVPFTVTRLVEILLESGLPPGVIAVVHGGAAVVNGLIGHPGVDGVTFVGSSPVAELVYHRSIESGKRAVCLGGAKNHLVVLPDADPDQASLDILNSFAGSAGQRCMAASVLVLVGAGAERTLERVIERAQAVKPGQSGPGEIGPVIDSAAVERIHKYISEAETRDGALIRVDGRGWQQGGGFWVGPTVMEHKSARDPAVREEIFGPVLSVVRVHNLDDAIGIINSSQFGNAASIYTRSGPIADKFTKSVHPGMIGVNVGVPVPREPFSFGGTKKSKFGTHDITGDGGIEFFTVRRKITTKWGKPDETDFVSRNFTG